MSHYKLLVEQLREEKRHEAADAIENLLRDIECRKTIAAGLVYLNGELAKVAAEKSEQIYRLQAEVKPLTNADCIRSMPDEELADFLVELADDGNLLIREWLKQPYKEDI